MKKLAILSILLGTFLACQNQEPLTLSAGEILDEFHEKHQGELLFMGDFIPYDKFSEKNIHQELAIAPSGNLHFRMFLAKTLTHYLHELEPTLATNDLCEKGNFQLTFFVDKKEIYTSKLPPGAGSCAYKNSATVYGIPLIDSNEADHWGRFLWAKFMQKGGGQEALSNGQHQLKIEVRPYIEHTSLKIGEIIAEGAVELTLVEKDVTADQIAIQKIQATNQWALSDFEFDTLRIRDLNKKIAQGYFKNITSIVLVKDGKLVLEEYFNGADRNTLHDTRSVGKTLASTLLGIAIDEKHIQSERQTLNDFYTLSDYAHSSEKKNKISIQHLLTMSSGLMGSDVNPQSPGNEENMYPTKNWVKFCLDLPFDDTKVAGKHWDYFTGGAVLLGDILDKTVPEGLEKYAEKKLFSPLDIRTYQWQYTPTNVPNTAGGFQMNSLDNAKYIQLYLENGTYRGKKILSKDWIDKSLQQQVSIPDTESEFYGYLFWNKTYQVNGRPYQAYYASGNGGNKLMVFKDLNLAIVLTATAYNQPYMHHQANQIIEKYLLESLF